MIQSDTLAAAPPPPEIVQGAFRALADPTRRKILLHLGEQDMTIAEVAAQFDMTRAAVKKHLTILSEGDLISVHPKGRERINRLEPLALKSVADWLNHFNRFWDERLAQLQHVVEAEEAAKNQDKPTKK
ncbi:MAG: helix-turn-helix transcriptional regulator [Rhizobiales bacterium]|nr:helix-turn-helix transcriptional regulator [Hyphomicrobiales bacterium]MBO6699911.1 helix-turn-helix transcriptional regulator [Hyphomicrobiales bacterium]MBO6737449.1 helix-turn-helix transcriptional regulator [Hyphomicrobiales bacterium]MBO6911477.1 helix-turn-helix transcriptional regulator [Hyphomicrobiales bacterium]MBO6955223.1 helix-turn-helix transcriptional regulator [Hyphomicrobiales bacterium]